MWMDEARSAFARLGLPKDSIQSLDLRESQRTGEKMAILVVSSGSHNALKQGEIVKFKNTLLSTTKDRLAIFLRIVQEGVGFYEMHLEGPEHYREILHLPDPIMFLVSPSTSFAEDEKEFEKRKEGVSKENTLIVDSCGAGVWPIALAPFVKKVIGLDKNPYALLDAKENAAANKIENISFYQLSLEEYLDREGIIEYNRKETDMVIL